MEDLTKRSKDELKKKAKDTKVLIGIFIFVIAGLLYFGLKEYFEGTTNTPITIITICSIGGLIALLPGLKAVQQELKDRD